MYVYIELSVSMSHVIIPFLNHLLDGDLCKMYLFSIFSLLLVFNYDFIIYINFTHVAASINQSINQSVTIFYLFFIFVCVLFKLSSL